MAGYATYPSLSASGFPGSYRLTAGDWSSITSVNRTEPAGALPAPPSWLKTDWNGEALFVLNTTSFRTYGPPWSVCVVSALARLADVTSARCLSADKADALMLIMSKIPMAGYSPNP